MNSIYVIPILAISGCFFIVSMIVILKSLKDEETYEKILPTTLSIIVGLAGAFFIFLSFILCEFKEPTALDVYRGKTELIQNGRMVDSTFVVNDSTVVFKK